MKGKKNLEKAIVLGLLLSTSVYSAAWADFTISEDGNTLISNGSPITDYKSSDFSGRELSSFKKIIIEVNNEPGLKTWSGKYNLNDTNVEITVNGYKSNSDGVHLTNWSPCFNVNSYTAVINANKSDALNLSQDATDPSAEINFLNAVVNDGNGIRANTHAGSFQNQTATITINKSTTITINAVSYTHLVDNVVARVARNIFDTSSWADNEFRSITVGGELWKNGIIGTNVTLGYAMDKYGNVYKISGGSLGANLNSKGISINKILDAVSFEITKDLADVNFSEHSNPKIILKNAISGLNGSVSVNAGKIQFSTSDGERLGSGITTDTASINISVTYIDPIE